MAQFYSLRVAEVLRETPDAVSISFEIPAHLASEFSYLSGQYLTLKANIGGEEVRRAYSLCSSPGQDAHLTVAVKEVQGGKMSVYLNRELKAGDTLGVMPPEGRFFLNHDAARARRYVLIAGGSGITPMISILRSALQAEPQSTFLLLYANRNRESIIFESKLDDLLQRYPQRVQVQHFLDAGAQGSYQQGPLNAEVLSRALQQELWTENSHAFICGPGPMMEQAKEAVQNAGLAPERIYIEYFSAPVATEKVSAPAESVAAPADGSRVIITLYGETTEVLIKDNTTILKAATKAGLDAPFSCEAGICSTCMARIIEGSASMDENNILSADEVKQGYVLTCQSHPTSAVVRLEYLD
jgi:ring-1,2-phenylacetyl-CoA epoxidase subunit PaaE